MGLSRLLYATNLEEPGNSLLGLVSDITKVGLQEVAFLHAMGKNTAERYCQDWQKRFGSQEVKVWAHGEEGDLVSSILKVTTDDSFSLVVAEFDTRTVSRSAVRSLVKDVAGPVLIVRRSEELLPYSDEGVFSHVVFATDWSPVSERAASFLSGFNALIKELDIVNVIRERLTVGEMRELKTKLQETRRAFSSRGVDAEFHIYAGRPAEEVMLAARDYNVTLIVMGTNRKPFMRSIFSGSQSYKVAEEAVVPALFIP